MKSDVTTSLVKAKNLCGTVVEVLPQQGLEQSYLPTKVAFHWQADRWAGLITRLQSAQATTMKSHSLDLGKKYEFATPSDTTVEAMKKSLATSF